MLIANRIKSYRLKHEYTQEYIAKQLEVSRVTVSNWEKGRTIPDVYNLMKLSDFYNVSIEHFIKEDDVLMIKEFETLAYNAPLKIVYGNNKLFPKHVYVKSKVDMNTGELKLFVSKKDLEKLKSNDENR